MRYKHWAGVCGAAIAVLAGIRPLPSGREQLMSVLITALGMLVVVLLFLDGRQAGQKTTEEKRRQWEKDLKRQLTQFRNDVQVFRMGLESVFGEHFYGKYQNPDHRPSIEAGIRKNVVGVPSQLSDPRGFRCSLIRICEVLQEWDEDADACRAAGKRFASAHTTTLSLIEVAAAELDNRDGLYGDLSFIGRVREMWSAEA